VRQFHDGDDIIRTQPHAEPDLQGTRRRRDDREPRAAACDGAGLVADAHGVVARVTHRDADKGELIGRRAGESGAVAQPLIRERLAASRDHGERETLANPDDLIAWRRFDLRRLNLTSDNPREQHRHPADPADSAKNI
jgi:hypothetical protein